MDNYIPTANPFNLATPPAWFLTAMYAYDPMLVIFPSVKEPLYRMGRRGRYGHGMLRTLKAMPDTDIYVTHRLWPWKSILPQTLGANWNRILLEIPDYDTQRFGNDPGEALDAAEARQEDTARRAMLDECDARSVDAYHTMKLMDGSRVGAGRRPEGAGYRKLPRKPLPRRQAAYRPQGFDGPGGAMFVGR